MKTVIVSGSAGLIGSETVKRFIQEGYRVVGIDNDMRSRFFGAEASTLPTRRILEKEYKDYTHADMDIRDFQALNELFAKYRGNLEAVVHTAAQPSHDWGAKDPLTDFSVNANGTLNMLEATRQQAPEAVFVFTSTNKVYGDNPNRLPLKEQELRWEIDKAHPYFIGVDEHMSLDQAKHSIMGVSKLAADGLVQEYGRYFDMRTVCLRGGCLTGPAHAGTEMHGFLSYLMKCAVSARPYRVFGYKGKQVRDNIHSHDFVEAIWQFCRKPRIGEVYNMGGSRHSNCSILEAIALCEEISGKKLSYTVHEDSRKGDHMWYISDVRKFQSHYPEWKYRYDLRAILEEIHSACVV
jgi:CDP-paratose 2-epimerase